MGVIDEARQIIGRELSDEVVAALSIYLYARVKNSSDLVVDVSVSDMVEAVSSKLGEDKGKELLERFGLVYWNAHDAVARKVASDDSNKAFKIINVDASDYKLSVYDLNASLLSFKPVAIECVVVSAPSKQCECVGGTFECPKCGAEENLVIKNPAKTVYGRHPKCPNCGIDMELVKPKWVDRIEFEVQEPIERVVKSPSRIVAVMRSPLFLMYRPSPGDRVLLSGFIKSDHEKKPAVGDKGTPVFEVVGVAKSDTTAASSVESIGDVVDDPIDYLSGVIGKGLVGVDGVCDVMALQAFTTVNDDDVGYRGRMHVLLVGPPSTGKSVLLQRMAKIVEPGVYVSAEHVTGVGLTVSVDRSAGGWTMRAGAALLADNGLLAIDEIDKANKDDINYLLELMESGKASVAKAGVMSEIKSSVTVLAAANPKSDDPAPCSDIESAIANIVARMGYDSIEEATRDYSLQSLMAKAAGLSDPVVSRFDIVVPMNPITDPRTMARTVTEAKSPTKEEYNKCSAIVRKITTKYCEVKMSDSAKDRIEEIVCSVAEKMRDLTVRKVQVLRRASEAVARADLSGVVEPDHVDRAFDIISDFLLSPDEAVEIRKIEGTLHKCSDSSGGPDLGTKVGRREAVLSAVKELYNGNPVSKKEIVDELAGDISREEIEEILDDLVNDGDLMEVSPGEYVPL